MPYIRDNFETAVRIKLAETGMKIIELAEELQVTPQEIYAAFWMPTRKANIRQKITEYLELSIKPAEGGKKEA